MILTDAATLPPRLEEDGTLRSDRAFADSGSPRRVYELTQKGHEYLARRVDDLERQQARIAVSLEQFARWKRKSGRGPPKVKRREKRDE